MLERLFYIFCTFVCNIFFLPTNQPRPQGFSLKKWVREKPWGRGCRLIIKIFPGKIAGKYNMENLKQATGEIKHKYMAPKIC